MYRGTTRHHPSVQVDIDHLPPQTNLIRSERQISNHLPKKHQQQHAKTQASFHSKLTQSDNQMSRSRATPPARPRSPSNDRNVYALDTTVPKTNSLMQELKPTKSSTMRAAAIRKKEETLERKRNDRYFPSSENKATSKKFQETTHKIDVQPRDVEKIKRKKKPTHLLSKIRNKYDIDDELNYRGKTNHDERRSRSQSKQRKSRRDGHQTDGNYTSGDDNNSKRHRSKSQKRTTLSDSHLDKRPHLPPLHHGRILPQHHPLIDYPLLHGHPLKTRFPYYDGYPPYGRYPGPYDLPPSLDIPPYLPPYHYPYDPFFDYEKRKLKPKRQSKSNPNSDYEDNGRTTKHDTDREDGAKSRQSRKSRSKNASSVNTDRKSRNNYEEKLRPSWLPGHYPHYYGGPDMLEIWRQERNDYLKRAFRPTIHDVLYSQQWMKAGLF